jgi:hypothetical protein
MKITRDKLKSEYPCLAVMYFPLLFLHTTEDTLTLNNTQYQRHVFRTIKNQLFAAFCSFDEPMIPNNKYMVAFDLIPDRRFVGVNHYPPNSIISIERRQ